jgi:hypothetical protein
VLVYVVLFIIFVLLSYFSWWYGGARLFDVSVAGTKIANIDLFNLVGKNAAYTTTLTVTTTGPTLAIDMVAATDKAKISAIEINAVADGAVPTNAPIQATKAPVQATGPTYCPVPKV